MKFKYLDFETILEHYPIKRSTLRNYFFHRETNGLNKSVIKINRKLMIKREEFEAWLESFSETKQENKEG